MTTTTTSTTAAAASETFTRRRQVMLLPMVGRQLGVQVRILRADPFGLAGALVVGFFVIVALAPVVTATFPLP